MYNLKERLLLRGAEALTPLELMTLILDDAAGKESIAKELLDLYNGDLGSIAEADLSQLRMVDGLGVRRAARVVAAFELGRRVPTAASEVSTIGSSADVVRMFRHQIGGLPHEECWVLYLNCASRLLDTQRISSGGVSSTIVDIRIIIKRAIELLATELILVHNHPSGLASPSDDDIALTKRLGSAATLFEIRLLDHIIISSDTEYSFASAGLL